MHWTSDAEKVKERSKTDRLMSCLNCSLCSEELAIVGWKESTDSESAADDTRKQYGFVMLHLAIRLLLGSRR